MFIETNTLLSRLNSATVKAAELCRSLNQSPPFDLDSILSADKVKNIPEMQAVIDAGIPLPALVQTLNTRLGGASKHHHI